MVYINEYASQREWVEPGDDVPQALSRVEPGESVPTVALRSVSRSWAFCNQAGVEATPAERRLVAAVACPGPGRRRCSPEQLIAVVSALLIELYCSLLGDVALIARPSNVSE